MKGIPNSSNLRRRSSGCWWWWSLGPWLHNCLGKCALFPEHLCVPAFHGVDELTVWGYILGLGERAAGTMVTWGPCSVGTIKKAVEKYWEVVTLRDVMTGGGGDVHVVTWWCGGVE